MEPRLGVSREAKYEKPLRAGVASLPLATAALVDVCIAATLAWVGVTLSGRDLEPASRRANRAFAAWWHALAAGFVLNALWEASAAWSLHERPSYNSFLIATDYVYVLSLVVAVWGILYYLLYLRTGRSRLFWPLTLFYAAYAAVALYSMYRVRPTGLNVATWFVGWDYASLATEGTLYAVLLALLLLPELGAIVSYAMLARETSDAGQRRHILVVAAGIFALILLPVLADAAKLGRFEAWQAGGRFISLAAALVIVRAYRKGRQGPAPPSQGGPPSREDEERRERALRERVQALV